MSASWPACGKGRGRRSAAIFRTARGGRAAPGAGLLRSPGAHALHHEGYAGLVHCPKPPLPKVDTFTDLHDEEPPIATALFPLSAKEGEGSLLVVHDLSFIERRAHEAEFYMALALIGVAAGLGLLATAIVLALLKGWNRSLRQAIANFNLGRADFGPRQTEMPIGRDIEAMLSELRLERIYADSIHVEWSPKTLHRLLDRSCPARR